MATTHTHDAGVTAVTNGVGSLPRPLLVQFWRCGKAHSDRGWSRCQTPDECRKGGCVKMRGQ